MRIFSGCVCPPVTVRVKVFWADCGGCEESVTENTKGEFVSGAFGVPLIVPVPGSNDAQPGNTPPLSDQVSGAVPLAAVGTN